MSLTNAIVGVKSAPNSKRQLEEIQRSAPKTRKAIRESWFILGQSLKNEARKAIRRKKDGRLYFIRLKKGKRVRRHVASKPGQTHANLTGGLMRSVSWRVYGYRRLEFGYGFSTTESNNAPGYAAAVEDGHPNRGRGGETLPRPTIANAVKATMMKTTNHFHRKLLKEFRRV